MTPEEPHPGRSGPDDMELGPPRRRRPTSGRRPENGGPRNRTRLLFWSLFTILIGVAAWLLFWPRTGFVPDDPALPDRESPVLGRRPVVLYFGDDQGRTLVSERREVPSAATLEARVEDVMKELAKGPDQAQAVATLPPDTEVRRAFYDEETATMYLDFSAALVTRHPGGSAAEYSTLGSIVRTVAANFPEVASVQILVEGQPIDSLAGHFDTSNPIDIATWQ